MPGSCAARGFGCGNRGAERAAAQVLGNHRQPGEGPPSPRPPAGSCGPTAVCPTKPAVDFPAARQGRGAAEPDGKLGPAESRHVVHGRGRCAGGSAAPPAGLAGRGRSAAGTALNGVAVGGDTDWKASGAQQGVGGGVPGPTSLQCFSFRGSGRTAHVGRLVHPRETRGAAVTLPTFPRERLRVRMWKLLRNKQVRIKCEPCKKHVICGRKGRVEHFNLKPLENTIDIYLGYLLKSSLLPHKKRTFITI